MPNIFREALRILDIHHSERTEEEETLLAAATIPLDLLPAFNYMTTKEGLEKLSKIVEGEDED